MQVDLAELRQVVARIRAQQPVLVAQAQAVDDVEGGPECAGRDYGDIGASYRSYIRSHLVQAVQAFGAQLATVSDNLAETGRRYASNERANEARLAP